MLLFKLIVLVIALSLIFTVIKNTLEIIPKLILIGFALYLLSLISIL